MIVSIGFFLFTSCNKKETPQRDFKLVFTNNGDDNLKIIGISSEMGVSNNEFIYRFRNYSIENGRLNTNVRIVYDVAEDISSSSNLVYYHFDMSKFDGNSELYGGKLELVGETDKIEFNWPEDSAKYFIKKWD